MKNLLNGEGNSSSLPFNEDHFRTPLSSMMARSRSPIILDNELNNFSGSIKPVMPLPSIDLPPRLKPKPKIIMSSKKPQTVSINEPHCETDADYEDVLEGTAKSTTVQNDLNCCLKPNSSATLVQISDDSSENYDRLKHFGFISKTAPGYRQIQPITFTSNHKPCIKSETVIMPARKADDSHYGYGTINKIDESRSNKETLDSVTHNELQYALVLKPNKV